MSSGFCPLSCNNPTYFQDPKSLVGASPAPTCPVPLIAWGSLLWPPWLPQLLHWREEQPACTMHDKWQTAPVILPLLPPKGLTGLLTTNSPRSPSCSIPAPPPYTPGWLLSDLGFPSSGSGLA